MKINAWEQRKYFMIVSIIILVLYVPITNAYSPPPSTSLSYEAMTESPHSWAIIKAIDLLAKDGYSYKAQMAKKYLLPMVEGVMFIDEWGAPDYDGSAILHYYVPDRPDLNYGFGSAFAAYSNPTSKYGKHPFYGYENAADYSQNRYDAAKRAYLSQWGSNTQDNMAGWVVDSWNGQDDPIDGKWANSAADIDAQTTFGKGQTPQTALWDLFNNNTDYIEIFPQYSEPFLSKIFVPTKKVLDNEPCWFDYYYDDDEAECIEAYFGSDGHGSMVYASWTDDGGRPMILYLPANSKENAFFLLGEALHLIQDNTIPVHTIEGSWETFQIHNDIEDFAAIPLKEKTYLFSWDAIPGEDTDKLKIFLNANFGTRYLTANVDNASIVKIDDGKTIKLSYGKNFIYLKLNNEKNNVKLKFDDGRSDEFLAKIENGRLNIYQIIIWNGYIIEENLPALNKETFTALYQWPPPKGEYSGINPAADFKERWYCEDSSHEYVRKAAEISHKYIPFIRSINTEPDGDGNWPVMGGFTTLELDMSIKANAGLINDFFNDIGILEGKTYDGCGGGLTSPTIPFFIVGDVEVPAGKTLSVDPGVTVRFDTDKRINAKGILKVDGSKNTIKFVSKADNTKGIKISSKFFLKNGGKLKLS